MLRAIVIALGIGFVGAGVWVAAVTPAWPVAIECAVFGLLILAGTFLERQYRSRRFARGDGWETTGERFVDPTTGELTQVRYNARTGERSYDPAD